MGTGDRVLDKKLKTVKGIEGTDQEESENTNSDNQRRRVIGSGLFGIGVRFGRVYVRLVVLVAGAVIALALLIFTVLMIVGAGSVVIHYFFPNAEQQWNKEHNIVSTSTSEAVSDITGSDYNKYTKEISQLDLNKVLKAYPLNEEYAAADKGLSARYWNSGYSPYSDIELYLLLTEICERQEINPSNANYSIIPADVLGTWYCETSLIPGTDGQNMFRSWDVGPGSISYEDTNGGVYKGYLQQDPAWYVGAGSEYSGKGFIYISSFENGSLSAAKRAIYGTQDDIRAGKGLTGVLAKAHGNSFGTPIPYADVKADLSIMNSSSGSSFDRPSYDFFPDAAYTYDFMLRTDYSGADMYTFNTSGAYNAQQASRLSAWISKLQLTSAEADYLAFCIYDRYNATREESIICPDVNADNLTSLYNNEEAKLYLAVSQTKGGLEFGEKSNLSFSDLASSVDNMYLGTDMNIGSVSQILDSNNSVLATAGSTGYTGQFGDIKKLAAEYVSGRSGEHLTNVCYTIRVLNIGLRMQDSLEAVIDALYNAPNGKFLLNPNSSTTGTKTEALTAARQLLGYDISGYSGTASVGTRGDWGAKTNATASVLDEVLGESYSLGSDPSDDGRTIASPMGETDCSGLTGYVYQHSFGIDLPATANDQWVDDTSLNGVKSEKVDKASIKPGDLIFFDTDDQTDAINVKYASHVGIYVGDGFMLEANAGSSDGYKVIVIDLWTNNYWDPRIIGYRHFER